MIQSRSKFNSKLKKIERSESAFYKYLAYSHGHKSDDKNLLLQLQDQNTARRSGLGADASRRERSVPARGRFHLGRGGQSVNSMKLYNFSSWEPGKKHQSTCRVS